TSRGQRLVDSRPAPWPGHLSQRLQLRQGRPGGHAPKVGGAGPARAAQARVPFQLTMAAALRLYALERLPHLKGAPQEARRINRYLNAAQMAPVECEPVALEQRHETGAHYQVT